MKNKKPSEVKPEVGVGATIHVGSDRYAGTIVRVSESGKTFWIQYDKSIRTDRNGQSESQSYKHEPNPNGEIKRVSRRKDGGWGITISDNYYKPVTVGTRSAYRDPSF
jgi:hypothetical protein